MLRDKLGESVLPAEWQARQTRLGDEAEVVTGLIDPPNNDEELLSQFGYDPDEWMIVGSINQWQKQQSDGSWRASYFFKAQRKVSSIDLPALYASVSEYKKTPGKGDGVNRVAIVALADVQAGKTGSRGGTPELVERLSQVRASLEKWLAAVNPSSTVLLEVGDLFEGFESGGNPMFTNDLSLVQQMDLAATEVSKFLQIMMPYGHVDVLAVPSNHTAWRNGKQNLGNPQDDLGLFVHRQVQRVADTAGWDVTWHVPAPYDESVVLDVLGTNVGVVHGNQFGPMRAVDWWQKQAHGGQPVGSADILVSGHYHHLVVLPTGRNPYTGRSKWWLQCPTVDNGSDWFRNKVGQDSDPGLLVFTVDADGFNLQSLTVL